MFWNSWNSLLEAKYPYRVLALYSDQELLDSFLDEFSDYPIYDIRAISVDEYDNTRRWDNIHIVVVL